MVGNIRTYIDIGQVVVAIAFALAVTFLGRRKSSSSERRQ